MQTTKKKPSLIFILVGAVLSGYLGYLINGAWTDGLAIAPFRCFILNFVMFFYFLPLFYQ